MSISIETNNFNEVVEHFNEAGELINQETRIAIDCSICQCKNLALVNPEFDQITDDTHEKYVVLCCGQAFGLDCLTTWVHTEGRSRANCPSCRSPVACQRNLTEGYALFGTESTAESQAKDIRLIRGLTKDCSQCTHPGVRPRRHVGQPPQPQRSETEQAQVLQEAEARLATVDPIVEAGASLGRDNAPYWDRIQLSITRLQTQLQNRNLTENPVHEDMHIQEVYDNAASAISRVTELTYQVDETTWGLVDALVIHIRSEAGERLRRERRNAEIVQQISQRRRYCL